MPEALLIGLLLVVSYLLGSIPSAVWLSRSLYGVDVRTLGSGNAGSTNMYRSFGLKAGLITQVVDILKGAVPTALPLFSLKHGSNDLHLTLVMLSCGLLAVIGHTFPVFAGFRGGKGVNTILGMMLVLHPIGAFSSLLVFALVLLVGRMVSLASLMAVYSFFFYSIWALWNEQPSGDLQNVMFLFLAIGIILSVYVTWSHRTNISRIRTGTERKVNLW
jgi:glycerol-3-phosphate acyltransferase PlsY